VGPSRLFRVATKVIKRVEQKSPAGPAFHALNDTLLPTARSKRTRSVCICRNGRAAGREREVR